MVKKNTDRISVRIDDLRVRLEKWRFDPHQSLVTTIRIVLMVGLDFLEQLEASGIRPPQPGLVKDWLREFLGTRVVEENSIAIVLPQKSISDLIEAHPLKLVVEQSGIDRSRLIALILGEKPTEEELSLLEESLEQPLEILRAIVNRDFPSSKKEKATNGS